MTHPVIGELAPHWAGIALGTNFDQFNTPTMNGLARVVRDGQRLELLAVAANHEGRGDAGRFLAACQAQYATVCVWDVMNHRLAEMLERRGFRPVVEWVDGELTDGFRWDHPAAVSSTEDQ